MSTSLTFPSQGIACDGWHFPAADDRLATDSGRPAVVMAHGFGATKDCGLESFAEHLAAAGLDVLAFDYRGFGASGGEPRQAVSPAAQVEDYRAALQAAAGLPGVDPQRLVLWGVSMAGGTVLEVAAGRSDIAAVIALTPLVSGSATPRDTTPLPTAGATTAPARGRAASTARLLRLAVQDKVAAATGRPRITVPVTGPAGQGAMLDVPGAYEDYLAIAGPSWRNEVTASTVLDMMRHRPNRFAKQLSCPVLFQIADFDRCVSGHAAMKAAVKARAQVRHYPCDHFDVYPGMAWHDAVREHQVRFLTRTFGRSAEDAATEVALAAG